MNQLMCKSAFRWPARIVSQESGGALSPITRLISFSPFPATLDLNPIVINGVGYYSREPLPAERTVTLYSVEPVAYQKVKLEVSGVRLGRWH